MSFLAGFAVGFGACLLVFLGFFVWVGVLMGLADSRKEKIELDRKRLERMLDK